MALTNAQIIATLSPIIGKAGAAGVAGNGMQESTNTPGRAGGGWLQWQGDRYTGLVNYANSRGLDPNSNAAALGYLIQDLKGPYAGLAKQLAAAKSPAQAALLFSQQYERPGIPMNQNRERYAQQAYGAGSGPSIPIAASMGGTPSSTASIRTTTPAKTDWADAGISAFLKAASTPIDTSGKVSASDHGLLNNLLYNAGQDTTPAKTTISKVKIPGIAKVTNPAAIPTGSLKGITTGAGVNVSYGEVPKITSRLAALARSLGVSIHIISGYRTPAHSVAVGGFADDPHTKGRAVDIGVNSALRASAAQLTNAQLKQYGLWRPFDQDGSNPAEVNHIELLGQK